MCVCNVYFCFCKASLRGRRQKNVVKKSPTKSGSCTKTGNGGWWYSTQNYVAPSKRPRPPKTHPSSFSFGPSQPHMPGLLTLLMLIGYASNISVLLFFFFFKLIKLRKDKKEPTAKTTFDQNKQFRQKNAFNELYV